MRRRIKYPVMPILHIIILSALAMCAKEVIKNDNCNSYEKNYLKEGFINSNTYRVVIIMDTTNTKAERGIIEERGRKRTFVSLQNYLRSDKRIIDKNVKAKILNLVNSSGKLTGKITSKNKSEVYYFELKKENIKRYIDKMAVKR